MTPSQKNKQRGGGIGKRKMEAGAQRVVGKRKVKTIKRESTKTQKRRGCSVQRPCVGTKVGVPEALTNSANSHVSAVLMGVVDGYCKGESSHPSLGTIIIAYKYVKPIVKQKT